MNRRFLVIALLVVGLVVLDGYGGPDGSGRLGGRGVVYAQSISYEQADIEYGAAVYRAQCVACHGDRGDGVPGVDLPSGQFRNAVTDRDLRRVISNGIPGTGMTPVELDAAETVGIVAYLRNMNTDAESVVLGDVGRGLAVFEGKGECLTCHRVDGRGPRVAPELSAIGASRAPSVLRRALLDPSSVMRPINRPVEVVTTDGERVGGRRLNEDTYTVQLIDENERLRSFDKADLAEYTILTDSPMPSYEGQLDTQELADVLAYLVSLKG
jgi:putative heme-binding domain-containing protein